MPDPAPPPLPIHDLRIPTTPELLAQAIVQPPRKPR